MLALKERKLALYFACAAVPLLAACGKSDESEDDSVSVQGNVPIAYVKRPNSTLGNPTDSIMTGTGGDLYIREKSSPSAPETNITGAYTNGAGDVSDPEVSYDGQRIIFAMRCTAQSAGACYQYPNGTGVADASWNIWEYDLRTKTLRRIIADGNISRQGNDADPSYLPDGRIVFVSTRQEKSKAMMTAQGISPYTYVDEYEREAVTAIHRMNSDGQDIKQLSVNQSHDRNPTVLISGPESGKIMFSRWDHVGGRNHFTIFRMNPDGTDPFILYGAHSPANSYLHPRELPDGRLISTLMPLSGTREGGSLEVIDAVNYSDNGSPASSPGVPNQLGETQGQFQVSRILFPGDTPADHQSMRGMGVSPRGRYSTPYPLWDGTNRVLVAWTPSQPVPATNALGQPVTVEGTPRYGVFMLDMSRKTLLLVVPQQDGFVHADPIPLLPRPLPRVIADTQPDPTIPAGLALFNVNTVYDTDNLGRMGSAVLAGSECIPRQGAAGCSTGAGGRPDIGRLKNPADAAFASRVARFFRITKAVPTPAGLSRETIGETEFEMQQIVGYGVVEPDGSMRTYVPAHTPLRLEVLDREGRAFTPHTHWLQALEGERRFCKGCHSARTGTTSTAGTLLNDISFVGAHPIPPGGSTTSTMAESRTIDYEPVALNLKGDISYTDFWTTKFSSSLSPEAAISLSYAGLANSPVVGPSASCTGGSWDPRVCSIVINYEDHIQPIWNAKCAGCHSGATPAGGLDLSNNAAGAVARVASYQALMVGVPRLDPITGLPRITINPNNGEVRIDREPAAVIEGESRRSRLVERIFEEPLRAPQPTVAKPVCQVNPSNPSDPVCQNDPNPTAPTMQNHRGLLTAAERRIVGEWIDIGGQYFNTPFDASGNVRSNIAALNETVFGCAVHPILMRTATQGCASCHQPFGGNGTSGGPANPQFVGNRFILTGNIGADFSVTASMVTNLANPDASLLLSRPTTSPPHPDVGFSGSADYAIIRQWIANDPSLTCP